MNNDEEIQLSVLRVLYDLAPQGSTNGEIFIGSTLRTQVVKEILSVVATEEQKRIKALEEGLGRLRFTHLYYFDHSQEIAEKVALIDKLLGKQV